MERLPKELVDFTRKLRRDSTDAERLLWKLLRNRRLGGFKFTRQKPFDPYVVDFYCCQGRLAIEVDGGQHAEPEQKVLDERRTEVLSKAGVRVLRFWNDQVLRETESVVNAIWVALQTGPPSPCPLPRAGEGKTPAGLSRKRPVPR